MYAPRFEYVFRHSSRQNESIMVYNSPLFNIDNLCVDKGCNLHSSVKTASSFCICWKAKIANLKIANNITFYNGLRHYNFILYHIFDSLFATKPAVLSFLLKKKEKKKNQNPAVCFSKTIMIRKKFFRNFRNIHSIHKRRTSARLGKK